jgi:hypothetical protein
LAEPAGGKMEYNPEQIRPPSNRSILIVERTISATIAPAGDSINVVFRHCLCKKVWDQIQQILIPKNKKRILYANADWALRAYHGEDRNRNGILDPGEDLDGDGKITRYILPAPPITPNRQSCS